LRFLRPTPCPKRRNSSPRWNGARAFVLRSRKRWRSARAISTTFDWRSWGKSSGRAPTANISAISPLTVEGAASGLIRSFVRSDYVLRTLTASRVTRAIFIHALHENVEASAISCPQASAPNG
jgi:hypothetical protein